MALLALVIIAANDPSLGWLDYVSKVGVIGLLILSIYGLVKKDPWWVSGREHRATLAREAEWRSIALSSTHLAESAAAVGEHLVERNKALREGE